MNTIKFNRKRLEFKKDVVSRMLNHVEAACHEIIDRIDVKDPMVLIKEVLDQHTLTKEPVDEQDNIPGHNRGEEVSGCSQPQHVEEEPEG